MKMPVNECEEKTLESHAWRKNYLLRRSSTLTGPPFVHKLGTHGQPLCHNLGLEEPDLSYHGRSLAHLTDIIYWWATTMMEKIPKVGHEFSLPGALWVTMDSRQ